MHTLSQAFIIWGVLPLYYDSKINKYKVNESFVKQFFLDVTCVHIYLFFILSTHIFYAHHVCAYICVYVYIYL